MAGLAILLLVQSATGSFAPAGLTVAAFAGGSAVGGVAQARWIDRTRQTPALVASGLAHPVALALLVPAARVAALPALLALAVVAGAATPQLSGCMPALWIELLREGPRRVAAFALEAVLVEAVFLVGPALVAGLLALTGPAGVLLLVAAASASGTLGLAATSASRGWRGRAASAPETGPRLAGPLSSPAIRFVLVAAVLFGIGDGAVQVAVAGFAVRHGSERLAGLLLTALSVGSVAAGLVYGTRSWRWSWPARFAALNLLLGSALALAAPAMRAGWPPAVAAALLLGGLAVAPIATENSLLIGSAAPPGTVTEAFAWLVTAVVAGGAAGSAVAGPLLDRLGAAPTMLLAALPPIAAGVATSLCRSAVGAESEPRP
jgi:predicted MFS family arabinose efflux permease